MKLILLADFLSKYEMFIYKTDFAVRFAEQADAVASGGRVFVITHKKLCVFLFIATYAFVRK